MTTELNRRSFLQLSGMAAASVLSAGSAAALEPEEAYASSKEYGTDKSSTYRSRVLLQAGDPTATSRMRAFKIGSKSYKASDTQALAVDEMNGRYYITRNDPSSSKRAFVFSCPMSATNNKQWKLVGKYESKLLGHANSMCAIPCGKGTKLLIATDTTKIRVIYIPDASKPSTGVKTSTWICDKFDGYTCKPRGIAYDRESKSIVVRNGLSSKSSNCYIKCFVFKAPTTKTTGTTHVTSKHYSARFELEVPKYVTAPKGILNKNTVKCYTTSWSRQDSCYDGTNYLLAYSNTKSGKYDGNVQRNVLVRWNIGSVASIKKKYASQMKKAKKSQRKPYRYSFTRAHFDRAVGYNKQGFEFEGLDCVEGTYFMVTNEGTHGKFDSIRSFTL